MTLDVKEFVKDLCIHECTECEEIQHLQKTKQIKVAPIFWRGEGKQEMPLVFMGINPSVVGADNEPIRGCDFESYFNYYQHHYKTETKRLNYWTMCHSLAKRIIGDKTPRWKEYVLMETIHCFYNKAGDLGGEEFKRVSSRCFRKHIRNILLWLKPQRMVLLGNPPYEFLKEYLKDEEDNNFYSLQIDGLKVPVLKHSHPGAFRRFYRSKEYYKKFESYCRTFNEWD